MGVNTQSYRIKKVPSYPNDLKFFQSKYYVYTIFLGELLCFNELCRSENCFCPRFNSAYF